MAPDNVLIMIVSQPKSGGSTTQEMKRRLKGSEQLAVVWDDFVVWYQNNNVLNYNNGILKFLPINKSTMCTLYVFIDIFVIDHLGK